MQVTLTNLTKIFNDKAIFRNLNFSFSSGRFYLSGGNGVGKTTLLKIIAGICTPSSGKVSCSDPVSYFANDWGMYGSLSVSENISHLSELQKNPFSVESVLDCWNILDIADVPVAVLSSGQRARVGIAISFLEKSSLYLFDEPMAYLDAPSRCLFTEAVKLLPKESCIICTGHETEELKKICDQHVSLTSSSLQIA